MPPAAAYLLDTNVVLQLFRGKRLGQYIENRFHLLGGLHRCVISVVTVGELLSLARQFRWGAPKVQKLLDLLDELVCIDMNNPDILRAYAEIDDFARSAGKSMGKNDVWIAATATASSAILLTNDTDFDPLDPDHLRASAICWGEGIGVFSGARPCRGGSGLRAVQRLAFAALRLAWGTRSFSPVN